jgi:nitrate reductase gamma subunit
MSDEFLFVVVPRAAVAACAAALLIRAVVMRDATRAAALPPTRARGALAAWWAASIGVVLLGHVLGLGAPAAMLIWNRESIRLLAIEVAGFAAGLIALVCVLAAIHREMRSGAPGRRPLFAAVAVTLMLLELLTGLGVAARYRWASSWAGVTLGPYLASLAGLHPSPTLIQQMPFAVKLHVFCAFAIVVAAPLSGLARTIAAPFEWLAAVAPPARAWRAAWRIIGAATTTGMWSGLTARDQGDDR